MERVRIKLLSVQKRVADKKLTDPAQIGAAAERALRSHQGYRYFGWEIRAGAFVFFEHPVHFPREQRLEGRYVIATSEANIDAVAAVSMYKELTKVERGFRRMKDVLSLRPVYHQVEPRVRAHIFVAALGLLLQTLLERRLDEAGVELSAEQALRALETVRHVTFTVHGQERSGVTASAISNSSPATNRFALTLPSRYFAAMSGRAGVRRGSSIALAQEFVDCPRGLAFAALGARRFGRRRPGENIDMQPAFRKFHEALQEQRAGDRAREGAGCRDTT